MTHSLPPRTSFENLKKQAKAILKRWHAGDLETRHRVRSWHPQYSQAADEELANVNLKLADCQLILAREFGFESWTKLKQTIELEASTLVDQFLTAATLHYGGEYHSNWEHASSLAAKTPQLVSMNIWSAAAGGDVVSVQAFLERDRTLANKCGGPHDLPPLMYLCYSRVDLNGSNQDAVSTARILLEHGADANAYYLTHGTYRFTCLTGTIGEGEGGVVLYPPHTQANELAKLLLEFGADSNESQGLYNSMFTGGTHWLQLLFDHGLNKHHLINWAEKDGVTMLDYLLAHACNKNMLDRAKLLLEHGANPKALDWYKKRPCYEIALSGGNVEAAELLVRYGAEVISPATAEERFLNACMAVDRPTIKEMQEQHEESQVSAWIRNAGSQMTLAADAGNVDAVRLMIELGFPIGDALFDAAWQGQFDIAKLLIAYGASVRRRHHVHFATPVGYANRAGHLELRDYLLDQDIDIFDAIRFGRSDRIDEILDDDSDALERPFSWYTMTYSMKTPENASHTPLVQAVCLNEIDTVRLLLKNGADRSRAHADGRTLLEVAAAHNSQELIVLLQ